MEPIRPQVDAFVLDWITREPLRREWFFERRDGNCRLMGLFARKLGETASTWSGLVAPWGEYVARALSAAPLRSKVAPATRLTQRHRREAKGQPSFQLIAAPKPDSVCRGCGSLVRRGRRYCAGCAEAATRENFSAGRAVAQQPESLAKRSSTQRQHKLAIRNWKAASLPAWMTPEVYQEQIQPALTSVATSRICSS